jgi:hypothetical protein
LSFALLLFRVERRLGRLRGLVRVESIRVELAALILHVSYVQLRDARRRMFRRGLRRLERFS